MSSGSLLRRQLGIEYDKWRVGHSLLAIAAVGLGLLHIQGAGYYVASPGTRALWTAIGGSLLAVLGYVRLIRPWSLLRAPYRVVAVEPERGDAWTVTFEPVGDGGLRFQPGQFAWLTLRSSPFAMKEHPFSFSSSPVRRVDGPYGAFTIDRHPAAGYVFIAGGIGIAPIMSMLRALADWPRSGSTRFR